MRGFVIPRAVAEPFTTSVDEKFISRLPVGLAGVEQRLRSGPRIDPTAWIAPGASVLGDVTIGEESSVWYCAVLRGDINRIVVGPRTNVQDGAIVHLADEFPCVIGELVTVGHRAIVHACTVDDEVLIGMGSTILDGAEIGARSIIGANTLVTAHTKIPPGCLVIGSPGKVVKQLSDQEQKGIARWARKYVENAKRFQEFYERAAST
jgi:carbonic anhydrase/acetyltransferase-like protein (isoleucine patch superfamily)